MKTNCCKLAPLSILLAAMLSGCGTFSSLDEVVPDNTKKYRKAETMPPLDVPPDLSTNQINDDVAKDQSSSATYSEFEEAASNPLASKYNIEPDIKPSLSGEGSQRHLVVPGDRSLTWQRIRNFWTEKGYEIKREDERIGLMDTSAGADDYAFRVRMDRGEVNKQARVYLNGRGDVVNSQKDEAMLRQLAEFLGVIHQQQQQEIKQQQQYYQPSQAAVKAGIVNDGDGYQSLLVEQGYPDVWSRVGRVLDRKGFHVEDRDRGQGVYFVRYIDPFNNAEKEEEGILDTLAFWKDDVDKAPEEFYYIKLISDAEDTRIIILDAEETRSSTDTSKRLLKLLHEQLTL
jgi:outer membrane protein assembly factor BamC